MKRWDRLKDRFMEAYEARGLAETTVRMMSGEWDRWGCWLKNRKPRPKLEEVDAEMVTAYIASRCQFHAKVTQQGVMSRMRAIGEFLVDENVWRMNFLRWMQGPRIDSRHRLPRRVNKSSLVQIMEAAATCRYEFSRYLWSAMLSVFYGTGIRRSELSRLNLSSWNGEENLLRIDGSKGRRERSVPLPPLAWQCLDAYLPRRQNLLMAHHLFHEEALFISSKGTRMEPDRLSQGFGNLMKQAGVNMTLHQLRHTCASNLIADGASLPHVQKLLGHKSVSTTMRYLHLAGPELAQAMELHPMVHLGHIFATDHRGNPQAAKGGSHG